MLDGLLPLMHIFRPDDGVKSLCLNVLRHARKTHLGAPTINSNEIIIIGEGFLELLAVQHVTSRRCQSVCP